MKFYGSKMASQIPLLVVAFLIAMVTYTIFSMQRTEQLTTKFAMNKIPYQFIPGKRISPIPDHYGASWDLRVGTGGLQIFCQPTGGLGSKLFTMAASIAMCAHKGLPLSAVLLKRIAKDPNSDTGPYDVLPAAFDNVLTPDILKDVFIYTNVMYLNYRSAASSREEEAMLDGIFPGVMMISKDDDIMLPVDVSSYASNMVATNIINGRGWANWRYFYDYERVVMDCLTMHPSLLEYCRCNYQYVYDSSFYTMGIFANLVHQNGKIVSHKPPVNPVFCAKVVRSLYEANPKIKRVVVLVFTPDDQISKDYYRQLFNVEGIHPVFVKENPYVILQLCQGLKYVIPDSGHFSWWCSYMCSYRGGSVFVPYGYKSQDIHPSWKVL
jgi:hypothetical protein